ncbi:MAG: AhpC/TSA family protein [Bacteroidaceae bacterium]|nr:AhpC/TSA family protein [Bacteroidaceae bacterium]
MNRKLSLTILLLGFLIALPGHSAAQTGSIAIKGKVQGIKKGRLHITSRRSEEITDTLAFCDFKKGKFAIEVPAEEPMVVQIAVEGYSGGFTLLAEPGTAYEANLSNDESFYIKGGVLNERYTQHLVKSDSMRNLVNGLKDRYEDMRSNKKFRSASLVNDTLRNEQKKLQDFTGNFLKENDNLIAAYTILSNIEMRDAGLRESKEMYRTLGEGAKATHCGRIIEERIDRMEKTAGGAVAPDFTLPDLNGNPVTMSSVKGKIKIIDFWASWCGPCRLNNPALKKLYDEFHSKGLEIIGISLDHSKAGWQKAIEKDGLSWINVSSLKGWDCEVAHQYNVSGVPALFILDENNHIIANGLRGEQLKAFLQERLK